MLSETLQALRAEIEAVTTLQLALNRLALSVDENALTLWQGPRPEDVENLAGDDGSLSRDVVLDLRNKGAEALATRYREVEQVVMGRAAHEALLRELIHVGSGGVITGEGPPTDELLRALARSGALRLDWAQSAVMHVRDALEARAAPPPPTRPARPPARKMGRRKAAATKAKTGTAGKKTTTAAKARTKPVKQRPVKKASARKLSPKAGKKTPGGKPARRTRA
jgi:hypothetical protein